MIGAPEIAQMNIDRYRAIAERPLADKQRAKVELLPAEAVLLLARVTDPTAR